MIETKPLDIVGTPATFEPFDIFGWQEGDGPIDHDLVEAVWQDASPPDVTMTSRSYGCFFFRHDALSSRVPGGVSIFLRPKTPPMINSCPPGRHSTGAARLRVLPPAELSRVMRKLYRGRRANHRASGSESHPLAQSHYGMTLGTWFAICQRFMQYALDPDVLSVMNDSFGDNPFVFYPGTPFVTRKVFVDNMNWENGPLP